MPEVTTLCFHTRDAHARSEGSFTFRIPTGRLPHNVTRVQLASCEFPMVQMTVERAWNRVYTQRGIRLDASANHLRVRFRSADGASVEQVIGVPPRLNRATLRRGGGSGRVVGETATPHYLVDDRSVLVGAEGGDLALRGSEIEILTARSFALGGRAVRGRALTARPPGPGGRAAKPRTRPRPPRPAPHPETRTSAPPRRPAGRGRGRGRGRRRRGALRAGRRSPCTPRSNRVRPRARRRGACGPAVRAPRLRFTYDAETDGSGSTRPPTDSQRFSRRRSAAGRHRGGPWRSSPRAAASRCRRSPPASGTTSSWTRGSTARATAPCAPARRSRCRRSSKPPSIASTSRRPGRDRTGRPRPR